MESIKTKLLLYGIISAITYIYLILTPNPGISVPLFVLTQFILVVAVVKNREEVKNKKGILILIPIFIMSLNYFISANTMWRAINFLLSLFLYSAMILGLKGNITIKKFNFFYIFEIIFNIFEPLTNFFIPFQWGMARCKDEAKVLLIKRILTGIIISVPCVLFLTMMLSSADMVFQNNIITLNRWFTSLFNFTYIFKVFLGMAAGLYLFGHLYNLLFEKENKIISVNVDTSKQIKGDVIVLNILLFSILVIYTVFIAIQFRYLFSSGSLPYDLNYAEYARRGFFELVFLSILNIALILLTIYLLKDKIYVEKSTWSNITKFMMIYLCIITGVLLISSFYRMSLYDSEYGFTRLRIIVYMFLLFEGIGLIATLIYIIKHNFNILILYAAIGLTYYLTLNIVRIDSIIAKRNIDMYLQGQTENIDMEYLTSLSLDAAPEIFRLLESEVGSNIKYQARTYFENIDTLYNERDFSWRSYNLSIERALN